MTLTVGSRIILLGLDNRAGTVMSSYGGGQIQEVDQVLRQDMCVSDHRIQ